MKTTNKQINISNCLKAFNFNTSNHLRYDLTEYINANLYADNITIQKDNNIIVFEWNFEPQKSGTYYQQSTYKNMTINNKAEAIIKHLTN